MKKLSVLEQVAEQVPNRRKFVGLVGLATAALGGAAGANAATTPSDADILNFALNLEYVDSELFTYATSGMTIAQMGVPINGTGNTGPTTDGLQVNFGGYPSYIQNAMLQLAQDERNHVVTLRNALTNVLGVTPIAKPAIDLGGMFYNYSSVPNFLALGRLFEDVGTSAYAGGAPLLTNKTIISGTARVLAAEAEHGGLIRYLIAQLGVQTGKADSLDILPPPTGSQFFPVTSDTAQVQVRTPGQVLYILYGFKANATSGGFLPNGANGNITMSSAGA